MFVKKKNVIPYKYYVGADWKEPTEWSTCAAHKRLHIVISPFCCVLGPVIIFPALRMKNGISI